MDLVFDIGYSHGAFAADILKKFPKCKVIGVEPHPLLSLAVKDNRITLLRKAVSDADNEWVDFYLSSPGSGASTISKRWMTESRFALRRNHRVKWDTKVRVKTITLDKMIETYGRPDLIKIDVEGYEYSVIRGLTEKQSLITLEWTEEIIDELFLIVNRLLLLGYKRFGVRGGFKEGDVFEKLSYNSVNKIEFREPGGYYPWNELLIDLTKACVKGRYMNTGMFFAK